ncbi:MAG: glycoside hydrolase N-terminal domain-containing protein, partial [Verrucomicrobiota bacterium]|nr:glycoside hydrolase N-terminal domain-containing protein [Verrucomicrobiota bacterium]
MKVHLQGILSVAWTLLAGHLAAYAAAPLTLDYDAPAATWNEALPLGNGRLGAMVFGGPGAERLQLNEDTLWDGRPDYMLEPRIRGILPE